MYVNASEMPWILTMIDVDADGEATSGELVYANECLYCHGVDRQGDQLGVYPALTDLPARLSRTTVEDVVRAGTGAMPSHEHLSVDEVTALLDHLPSVPIGQRGSYAAYREPWAVASNTPYRRYKSWMYEGDIKSPLIAHWPGGLEEPGRFSNRPGHVIDIMATALELASIDAPADDSIAPPEGQSFLGVITGGTVCDHDALYWEHLGHRAIRKDGWKAVFTSLTERWELFRLDDDPTEIDDVGDDQPDRLAELIATWTAWAAASVPVGNLYSERSAAIGVGSRGAPGRQVTRRERNAGQQDRNSRKRRWVRRADAEEHPPHDSRHRERPDQSEPHAQQRQAHALAKDEAEDLVSARSKRHPDTEFLVSLCDGVRHHAVDAHGDKHQTEQAEGTEQHCVQSTHRRRCLDHLIHQPDAGDRNVGVEIVDDLSNRSGQAERIPGGLHDQRQGPRPGSPGSRETASAGDRTLAARRRPGRGA